MIHGVFHHLHSTSDLIVEVHLHEAASDKLTEAPEQARNLCCQLLIEYINEDCSAENELEREDGEELSDQVD